MSNLTDAAEVLAGLIGESEYWAYSPRWPVIVPRDEADALYPVGAVLPLREREIHE